MNVINFSSMLVEFEYLSQDYLSVVPCLKKFCFFINSGIYVTWSFKDSI